jgi:hypothetical protein
MKSTIDIISYNNFWEEDIMTRKMLISIGFAIVLLSVDISAKGNTEQMVKLAEKQENLSYTLVTAYKKKDNGNAALDVIKTLESSHSKLKSSNQNDEIDNLLAYLDICLKDLKVVVKKPYSILNSQRVSDLTASLLEGSIYIQKTLKKHT